jgi:hypothetical protein
MLCPQETNSNANRFTPTLKISRPREWQTVKLLCSIQLPSQSKFIEPEYLWQNGLLEFFGWISSKLSCVLGSMYLTGAAEAFGASSRINRQNKEGLWTRAWGQSFANRNKSLVKDCKHLIMTVSSLRYIICPQALYLSVTTWRIWGHYL